MDYLQNIFKKKEPSRVCEVLSREGGSYLLVDRAGRRFTATSHIYYPEGANLLVKDGQIMGLTIPYEHKTVEV